MREFSTGSGHTVVVAIFLMFFGASAVRAQDRPIVQIAGEGNLTVASSAAATTVGRVGIASGSASVSKHDQTIEMAEDLRKFCPSVDVELDGGDRAPSYFIGLNREGAAVGRSQVIVLDAHRTVIVATKALTVANATKIACNTILDDWQANGGRAAEAAEREPRGATVALVVSVTAKGQKYFKQETISEVREDLLSYLRSRGTAVGPIRDSNYVLRIDLDRPASKWIQIDAKENGVGGATLWSDRFSDSGWGHLGEKALENVLAKLHSVLDVKLEPASAPLVSR